MCGYPFSKPTHRFSFSFLPTPKTQQPSPARDGSPCPPSNPSHGCSTPTNPWRWSFHDALHPKSWCYLRPKKLLQQKVRLLLVVRCLWEQTLRSETPFMGHFMPYFVEGQMELLGWSMSGLNTINKTSTWIIDPLQILGASYSTKPSNRQSYHGIRRMRISWVNRSIFNHVHHTTPVAPPQDASKLRTRFGLSIMAAKKLKSKVVSGIFFSNKSSMDLCQIWSCVFVLKISWAMYFQFGSTKWIKYVETRC